MKGLILKDIYVLFKYLRPYMYIVAFFVILNFISPSTNLFFILYPCSFCSMIPIGLVSYDKAFRWDEYSATLPYTKGQLVSAKYIIALSSQLAALTLTSVAYAVSTSLNGFFEIKSFIFLMMTVMGSSLLTSAVSLPLILRFGAEKARIILYGIVGVTIAICTMGNGMLSKGIHLHYREYVAVTVVFCAVLVLYALSWLLSVRIYKRRET
ncbi:MAG: ABC-2 transporter permease [Clostridia bacterium]|nr:ABC-2 transporter permease [Clostridia bacterium]